jgi:hypothetical protein
MTPFLFVPAIVLLIGIFYNMRALYRKCSTTRFADKASAFAIVFAVLSLSLPMLLFVGLPPVFKMIAAAVCIGNFAVALTHIVRWFGGARRAEQEAQNAQKKGDKRG